MSATRHAKIVWLVALVIVGEIFAPTIAVPRLLDSAAAVAYHRHVFRRPYAPPLRHAASPLVASTTTRAPQPLTTPFASPVAATTAFAAAHAAAAAVAPAIAVADAGRQSAGRQTAVDDEAPTSQPSAAGETIMVRCRLQSLSFRRANWRRGRADVERKSARKIVRAHVQSSRENA